MIPKGYLIGNLTADPISGVTNNSRNYARFSVACNEIFQKDGQTPKTHFFNCVSWGMRSEFISKNIKKGDRVFLEFSLVTNSYTNNEGKIVKTTDLIVDRVELLIKRSAKSSEAGSINLETETSNLDDNIELPLSLEDIFNN